MYSEEVVSFCNSLTKDNIVEKLHLFLTKEKGLYTEEEKNSIIVRIVENLVEIERYEFIERVIGTKEKLKELMKHYQLKQEYLYHFYLGSLSSNGKFEELIETFEEIKPREELRLYLEKIRFNVGRAYSQIGKHSKGIEILEENTDVASKLYIVQIYSLLEDDKALEICKELQKSGLYLTPRDEARIHLTYAKFSLRQNKTDETIDNIDKLLFFITGVKTGLKNVLFYEVAQLYKSIDNEERYIYYLKQAGEYSAKDEVQMSYKLMAIIELQNLDAIEEIRVVGRFLPNSYLNLCLKEKYLRG